MLTAKVRHGSRTWHIFDEDLDRTACEPNTDYDFVWLAEGEPSCIKCMRARHMLDSLPVGSIKSEVVSGHRVVERPLVPNLVMKYLD